MPKRTTAIVLAAVAGAAIAGTVAYFALRDRFNAPQAHEGPKKNTDDKAVAEEPDDPSLFKAAPTSLASAVAVKAGVQVRRAAVVRGRVLGQDGKPLEKVKVGVAGSSSSNLTLTGADGGFDLTINGGGPLMILCESKGFLPARRQVFVPWQDYVVLPDVVLAAEPARVGVLSLPWQATPDGAAPVVRGERLADEGPRQATLLAPPDFAAATVYNTGSPPLRTKVSLSLREYGAGPRAAAALPASPPAGSDCAYAFELVAEESVQPSAHGAAFTPELVYYVENFLRLPVGTELPTYRYDVEQSRWLPGPVGRVVRADDPTNGSADKVETPQGETKKDEPPADSDAKLAEPKALSKLYAKEQTLWRLPLPATGSWAVFFPLRPPEGAVAPPWSLASVAADAPDAPHPAAASASLAVPGTSFQLCYSSERAPGVKAPSALDITLSDAEAPKGLKRIDLEVQIAGVRHTETFPPNANQKTVFRWDWDGLDGHGRPAPGRRPATVRVGYVYDTAPPVPRECVLWREQRVMLGGWDARTEALGGWTLNIHHSYDPVGRILHLGGGGRREAARLPAVLTTIAGTGVAHEIDDAGQPAILADLNQPRGLAVGPDGTVFIADALHQRVCRVKPDGLLSIAAGTRLTPLNEPTGLALGPNGRLYIADNLPSTKEEPNDRPGRIYRLDDHDMKTLVSGYGQQADLNPMNGVTAMEAHLGHLRGLAVGPYGDLYVTDHYNNQCVCRIDRNGVISFFLGGPHDATKLRAAVDVVAAADGAVYVADGDGCRVWRVAPDRTATVAAGTGEAGFSGDGGPAVQARLNAPSGLALGPDGSLYIADARNGRVRRVGPNGVITTVAGGEQADAPESGDGPSALKADLKLYLSAEGSDVCGLVGVAVGPNGDLYVSEPVGHRVRRIAPAFDGISDSEILITSEDGKELYVFDGVGRHLKTLDAATGALIYRFGYDAAWRLKEIYDGSGAVTRVERKGGRPTALVAPDGKRTTLETGPDSRLIRVAFPTGEPAEMEYDAGGLLTSFKDGQGQVQHFHYTDDGRPVRK